MKNMLLMALSVALALGACTQKPPAEETNNNQVTDITQAESTCPDDGPRFPLSGICQGRAVNFLNLERDPPYLPDNCTWTVNETEMADQVLLYQAASCDGRTTKLQFAGGARAAEFTYEISAFQGDLTDQEQAPLIRVITSDPADPTANLLAFARSAIEDPAEAAQCVVKEILGDGDVPGHYVVDLANPPQSENEPRTACGPYGLDEDSQKFWRISDGFSWFFDLGQDVLDFDPYSMVVVERRAIPDGDSAP